VSVAVEDPWASAMRRGDFEAAWAVSDEVLRERAGKPCWDWPRHLQYVWSGEPLDGKHVLVRCYHGLGDTLQFSRYLPLLKTRARRVSVWVQPALLPLLRGSIAEVDDWLPLHDGTPEIDYEADIELMELAHYFRTTWATIPNAVPYLHVPARTDHLGERRAALEVGLVWRSGDWDERRSLPLPLLAPWMRLPGVRFHALQRGAGLREWPVDWGPDSGSDNVQAVAGRMHALDLVISVDSMPAHLAGALGVPVWTLLHADADWRWMQGRSDSPWYPTMTLFRQLHTGQWDAVVQRVGLALARVLREASVAAARAQAAKSSVNRT
jgi:hypothetical protein